MQIYLNRIGSIWLLILILTTLGCRKIDVEEFSSSDPNLSFAAETFEVSNEALEYDIEVKSNLPWRVKTDAPWISFVTENGPGDGTFKIGVARNRTTETRTAEVIAWVTDDYQKVFTITQQAGEAPPDFTQHFYVKVNGSVSADGLSWGDATTLDNALDIANSGDFVHIAAGTYKPGVVITNGVSADQKDYTFEIKTNLNLIGGYSANPQGAEQPNAQVNQTILSGNLGTNKVRHVITVTAIMETDKKVSLSGLIIKEGQAGGGGSGNISIDGTNYSRQHGGGMIIGKSNVLIDNCQIIENSTDNHAAGMYITNSAVVTIKNSSISNNVATVAGANGGGIWNDGSTIYMYDTTVDGNRVGGVGAGVYALNTARVSYTFMYNVTISNNVVGIFGNSRAAAGYYGRERSEGVMVNCTVAGNVAQGNGAGISMYGASKLDIISSTITGNSSATASGIHNNGNNTINIYNSIVAGNSSEEQTGGNAISKRSSSIIGGSAYDEDDNIITAASFDASTMLGTLANNGGLTKTILLTGTNNPAIQYGMTALQLQLLAINDSLDETFIMSDQTGKDRSGKTTMGAVVN